MKLSFPKTEPSVEFPLEKKGKASTSKKYPSKTTVNLAMRDAPKTDSKKRLPILLVCGLVLILTVKFGVVDLALSAIRTESKALEEEGLLIDMQTLLIDYDKVEEEYQNYTLDHLAQSGSVVSTMEALALVEQYLLPSAAIETFAVQGAVMTVTLNGVTLNDISTIYDALKTNEKIMDVRVYTATTGEDQSVTTTCNMTIFFMVDVSTEGAEGGSAE